MRPLLSLSLLALAPLATVSAARGQQLVADLNQTAAIASSNPDGFVALPAFACFTATTSGSGSEPWVTDGSAAGTFRLRDLVPGNAASSPKMLCEYGGEVLFRAWLPGVGYQLFRTDGTTAGTTPVANPGLPLSFTPEPRVFPLTNGPLLVVTSAGTFATDLTLAGTVQLPGLPDFYPGLEIGGVTYGVCRPARNQFELWATDGTVVGTRQITTAAPGGAGFNTFRLWNGRIYFFETSSTGGWISSTDGVSGRTQHVRLGSYGYAVSGLYVRNGRLVFLYGDELYSSDLTATGTGPVALPCTALSNLVELGGQLFVRGTSPANGSELWATDGTAVGTVLVADLMPGPAGSNPRSFAVTGTEMFFRADDPLGTQLVSVSATGTLQVLGPLPTRFPAGTFTPFAGGVVFGASDARGNELWLGSSAQPPHLVRDIQQDPGSTDFAATSTAVAIREHLHFVADDGTGDALWRTNGITGQTRKTLTTGSSWNSVAEFGERIVFNSYQGLGLVDGLTGSSVLLHPGFSLQTDVTDDLIWFVSDPRAPTLYRSNGSAAGTAIVPATASTRVRSFMTLPDRVVLSTPNHLLFGTDGIGPLERLSAGTALPIGRLAGRVLFVDVQGGTQTLRTTDGTAAGTTALATIPYFFFGSATGGRFAYLIAGGQVWQTDGTAGGTAAIATLPQSVGYPFLVPTENELFCVLEIADLGRELFHLDRAAGQLTLVTDLAPGIYSGVASAHAVGRSDLVLVAGGNEITGVELYVSDGTAAGTVLVADVRPGSDSSNPVPLGIADERLYFVADDGVHGREPWSVPLAVLGVANTQAIGRGCPGSAGSPRLTTIGASQLGNAAFGLRLDDLPPLAPSLLAVGSTSGRLTVGPCELLIAGNIATAVAAASTTGSLAFALPIPSGPNVVGFRFVAQGFALDPFAPLGLVTSNGQIGIVGR